MRSFLIVLIAGAIGCAIVAVELARWGCKRGVDFLRATNAVMALCFVVLPIYLQVVDVGALRATPFYWILKRPLDDESIVLAVSIALLGYLAMVLAYRGVTGPFDHPRYSARASIAIGCGVRDTTLFLSAVLLGVAGAAALLIYTAAIGGPGVLILQAAAFRTSDPPVITPLAFLKSLAPMVMASYFVFWGIAETSDGTRWRRLSHLGKWIMWVASMVLLVHQAGRLAMALFLVAGPLARAQMSGRWRIGRIAAASAALGALFLFGKQAVQSLIDPVSLVNRVDAVRTDVAAAVRLMLVEFSFPVVTLGNAVSEVPAELPYRWFQDLPLAVQYLIPQRLLGVSHPPTVTMINSDRFVTYGAVPVDLFSFGYFSAGLIGVMLVCITFGAVLGWCERAMPPSTHGVAGVIRVLWVVVLSTRIMYGDPQLFWNWALHLLVLGMMLVLLDSLGRRCVGAPDATAVNQAAAAG